MTMRTFVPDHILTGLCIRKTVLNFPAHWRAYHSFLPIAYFAPEHLFL
jgi:hypothetical protein